MRLMFALSLLLSVLTLAACSNDRKTGGIPIEKPLLTGTITQQGPSGFLIEEKPGQQAGDAKCWAKLTDKTAVWRQAGKLVEKAAAKDVTVGQQVSLWPDGPVRESYPCQAGAGTVLILGGP